MTCIVGVETADGVILGGDSAGASGWSLTLRADQKVFQRGAYVMGFTTSFRMGQLLRYSGSLSEPTGWDVDRFMVDTFVPEVRAILRDGGWLKDDNGRGEGGDFLVGIAGRLYAVHSDFQIARTHDGYAAVGCGADLALGSLHATLDSQHLTAEARTWTALQAAAHHSAGVAAPFHMVKEAAA